MSISPALLIKRLMVFRREAVLLWHAFFDPATPLYLKAAMLGVVVYLLSPVDLIPDIFPVIGWLDDLILVPLMVSWIVSRLPVKQMGDPREGKTIDGTARRR